LTKNEFGSILEEHNFFATNKELDLLFNKYDRDRDGRVTYSEFFTETLPKETY
jgi:Ca2+-binding EF-hand superfamily protein